MLSNYSCALKICNHKLNMTSFRIYAFIVSMLSLPRFNAYQETFCLMDLCGLEQQVRETCTELSGDELICSSGQEEKTKVCKFECSSSERSYEETMFVLRTDHQIYYCSTSMANSQASNYVDTIGWELSYINCDLLTNLNKPKLNSNKDTNQELPEVSRRAQESCKIRLNLYSVYFK
jgi:hypothetical protein